MKNKSKFSARVKVGDRPRRSCNICNREFAARNRFQRFCDDCKYHSDVYHYSEWMGESSVHL